MSVARKMFEILWKFQISLKYFAGSVKVGYICSQRYSYTYEINLYATLQTILALFCMQGFLENISSVMMLIIVAGNENK